ncbi:MAG TPA: site-2 protease family protein [Ktedonobacterales bacterium]|nr:site-2 protease family protein [Ktedonobacterales bacterium]
MDSHRSTGFGQSSGDQWGQPQQYAGYPPPPEYFQSPMPEQPAYPPEPDYFRSVAQPQPEALSNSFQPGYLPPDYYNETPTNQLTDIRYDQPNKKRGKWAKAGGAAGTGILGLLLKFGALILGGIKYLFLVLKLGPVLSIVISLALYAAAFGWQFGVGVIFLLFLHEMGHVLVLRAKGVPASAPIFIPFFGAFVAMKGMPHNAKDEAEIAIAGPILGTVAALLCFLPYYLGSHIGLWPALAYFGFFINLFNLIPITPLDGGRIVGAISRWVWIVGLVLLVGLLFLRFNLFLLLIVILSGFTAYHQFRHADQMRSYYQVPLGTKIFIGIAYFGLAAFLAIMMHYATGLIPIATGY